MAIPSEWLVQINQKFRESGMELRKRPWEAVRAYAAEKNISINLHSPLADEIFSWFEARSRPGEHEIGSLYESVYFSDSTFWPVSVPIMYGTVKLNILDGLYDMPEIVKKEFFTHPKSFWDYAIYYADCIDYALGIESLRKRTDLDKFGMQLLKAADQELRSAATQLKESRPHDRAILSSRLATEMFLKTYIALKSGLPEKEAKNLSHNLEKSFDRFVEISGYTEWAKLKDKLRAYPPIGGRYNEQDLSLKLLWDGFAFAQSIGTVIVREYTGRNSLEKLFQHNAAKR